MPVIRASRRYITPDEGHDDDPAYNGYVLFATICFLLSALGLVLTYCACYHCKAFTPANPECGPVPCLEFACPEKKDKETV